MDTRDASDQTAQAAPEPAVKPPGTLRDFVLANFPLLGAIGGLIGIATFVVALPLYASWVSPYLVFLLLSAAVLIWLELLAQWPVDLLIYRGPPPPGTSWRLVGFAYALQLTMVGFIGAFLWRLPRLVVPALAAAIGVGVWQFLLPRRIKERHGVLLLVAVVAWLASMAVLSLVHPTYQSIFAGAGSDEP